jgi:hypothetical protein
MVKTNRKSSMYRTYADGSYVGTTKTKRAAEALKKGLREDGYCDVRTAKKYKSGRVSKKRDR